MTDPTVPLAAEQIEVATREREAGRVRLAIRSIVTPASIDAATITEECEIQRIPVGRFIDHAPDMRIEGDTVIVPVIEERPVVVTRLYLREEVRLRRVRRHDPIVLATELRSQTVDISRIPAGPIEPDHQTHEGSHLMQQDTTGLGVEPSTDTLTDTGHASHGFAALFATRTEAEHARASLINEGVPQGDISVVDQTTGASAGAQDDGGFWASVRRLFSGEEDVSGYAEGIRRGQTLVSVHTTSVSPDRVATVLEQSGPIDLDAQEASWRQQGWSGRYEDAAMGGSPTGTRYGTHATGETLAERMGDHATTPTGTAAAGPGLARAPGSITTGHDEVVRLAEERLAVGKRDVTRGTVRVRAHVVETPVHEQVRLRQEQVHVERSAASDAAVTGDADLFRDRVIEATETVEEPVISKTTHVTGEVGLRKDVTERTEEINETVRRTEVDVEDKRDKTAAPQRRPA